MLLGYSGLLNLCDSNASTKFSVVTRKLNRRDFEDYTYPFVFCWDH